MARIKYNRLKLLLILHEKSGKELAAALGVSVATVSKWCTNRSQPDVPMLFKIALFLDIEIEELLTVPRMISPKDC